MNRLAPPDAPATDDLDDRFEVSWPVERPTAPLPAPEPVTSAPADTDDRHGHDWEWVPVMPTEAVASTGASEPVDSADRPERASVTAVRDEVSFGFDEVAPSTPIIARTTIVPSSPHRLLPPPVTTPVTTPPTTASSGPAVTSRTTPATPATRGGSPSPASVVVVHEFLDEVTLPDAPARAPETLAAPHRPEVALRRDLRVAPRTSGRRLAGGLLLGALVVAGAYFGLREYIYGDADTGDTPVVEVEPASTIVVDVP